MKSMKAEQGQRLGEGGWEGCHFTQGTCRVISLKKMASWGRQECQLCDYLDNKQRLQGGVWPTCSRGKGSDRRGRSGVSKGTSGRKGGEAIWGQSRQGSAGGSRV